MKLTKKQIFAIVLTLVWTGLIFRFSLQPAEQSASLSSGLLRRILNLVYHMSGFQIPIEKAHHLFRKLAHFGEFFILGLCSAWQIKTIGKKFWYALGYGAMVAITDECLQFFIGEGRAMRVTDMGIDILGVATALAVVSFVLHFCTMKRNRKFLSR